MGKTAREVMSGGAECVGEKETIADAAGKLAQLDVGAMPICGEDDRLKGMLVITGQVTEQCILYSALDAYVRHFDVVVPRDAVAHIHSDLADAALRTNMRAQNRLRPATRVRMKPWPSTPGRSRSAQFFSAGGLDDRAGRPISVIER
jgi:CBS-domain-containing membrane protein